MISNRNIDASNTIPYDLAQALGRDGINVIIETLWLAYHELKRSCVFNRFTHENIITQEWGIYLTELWYQENRASRIQIKITPINQYENESSAESTRKAPQIDFCFRSWDEPSYFGIECKNLYSKRPDKTRRYVEKGVNHFVSGYYASSSTVSTMIGYVLSGSVEGAVRDLLPLIESLSAPIMNLTRDMLSQELQYKSRHLRTSDSKEILIYHLFFDFAA